ncbi:hypothetical protein BSK49_10705 [Paenibacillus odorifer]|jgi:hypothetical protein|nr:DUF5071 domain-containing protein [Paenibacillus odorifer]OMD89832.1 hypothetical protein BSK49_10705 [Paenibacillus odorifer]
MSIRKLLPKDKHDFDSVKILQECDKDAIRTILPDLFEWLQDSNWPISIEISDILLQFNSELVPFIRDILNSEDGLWKCSILSLLFDKLSLRDKLELVPDLQRLSTYPTLDDKDAGIDEITMEILERLI